MPDALLPLLATGPGGHPDAECPRRVGKRQVVLVTGMSGAGRSSALRALEDLGWEAVDNLPPSLLDALLADLPETARPLAVGVDVRSRGFRAERLAALADGLAARPMLAVSLLFLDAEDAVLARRFTETRRRHPLAGSGPLADGIAQERAILEDLRMRADLVIDTSALAARDLKQLLGGHFGADAASGLTVSVMSFSYRVGVPPEADLVFDLRFLANPHYDPVLRPLTGLDAMVVAHVAADPDYPRMLTLLDGLMSLLLPRYAAEGKSYLTLALGCTGGRHRSVAVAETVAAGLALRGYAAAVRHRDLARSAP